MSVRCGRVWGGSTSFGLAARDNNRAAGGRGGTVHDSGEEGGSEAVARELQGPQARRAGEPTGG
jgi:hypothetical protein